MHQLGCHVCTWSPNPSPVLVLAFPRRPAPRIAGPGKERGEQAAPGEFPQLAWASAPLKLLTDRLPSPKGQRVKRFINPEWLLLKTLLSSLGCSSSVPSGWDVHMLSWLWLCLWRCSLVPTAATGKADSLAGDSSPGQEPPAPRASKAQVLAGFMTWQERDKAHRWRLPGFSHLMVPEERWNPARSQAGQTDQPKAPCTCI